jgi:galactose-1-phosphate uridylyltransferase
MYYPSNTEISRSADTPLYLKKEQRINDRLQDKITILKAQAQSQESIKPQPHLIVAKDTSATLLRKAREEPKREKEKEKEKNGLLGLLASEEGKDSRIVHNNWIINNQPKEDLKNQKQASNKSVIVVKPNHALQSSDQNQPPRSSVRKVGS